jgi:hypothetical protein
MLSREELIMMVILKRGPLNLGVFAQPEESTDIVFRIVGRI